MPTVKVRGRAINEIAPPPPKRKLKRKPKRRAKTAPAKPHHTVKRAPPPSRVILAPTCRCNGDQVLAKDQIDGGWLCIKCGRRVTRQVPDVLIRPYQPSETEVKRFHDTKMRD
jgi:hypothetical protein